MASPTLKDVWPDHQGHNFDYYKHWKTNMRGTPCVALCGTEVSGNGAVYFITCKDNQEIDEVLDKIDKRLQVFYG